MLSKTSSNNNLLLIQNNSNRLVIWFNDLNDTLFLVYYRS